MRVPDFTKFLPYLQRVLADFKGLNSEEREDAAQVTMIRAHKAYPRFEGTCKVRTWLTTIARNTALDMIKRRKLKGRDALSIEDFVAANKWPDIAFDARLEDNALAADGVRNIMRAVERLPYHFREIVSLVADGGSYEEISERLQIPVGTVKSRLFRARRLLSEALPEVYA